MEKRYQVFVSSTFTDLIIERQKAIQALLKMEFIPAGMELFPAADENQIDFIFKVIDNCDYYLLIIGGRYGSITSEGVSYTEKEYDYAVSKQIRVIALVHDKLEEIPYGKSEQSAELKSKLEAFRKKVMTGRLVERYSNADEIEGKVILGLLNAKNKYPAIGWIRANAAAKIEVLEQINSIRNENDALKRQVVELYSKQSNRIEGLAQLSERVNISLRYKPNGFLESDFIHKESVKWSDLFSVIAPYCQIPKTEYMLRAELLDYFKAKIKNNSALSKTKCEIVEKDFQVIAAQFVALGFIELKADETGESNCMIWHLTDLGRREMYSVLTVKSKLKKKS